MVKVKQLTIYRGGKWLYIEMSVGDAAIADRIFRARLKADAVRWPS